MLSIDERREAAERLRSMRECRCLYAEQFYELLREAVMDDLHAYDFSDVVERLADLVDPAGQGLAAEDNLRLIERSRQLEGELAACKARLGAASRVAVECRERARTIEEGCGDREIRGNDLGRMHAYHRVADELAEAVGA